MPTRWFELLSKFATRRVILILAVVFVVLFLGVFPLATARLQNLSGGVSMIDMLTSYTPAQVNQMIAAYTPAGRSLYILTTLTADLVFPLDYSLLFALLIIVIYARAFPKGHMARPVTLFPFLTALFDLLENASIVTMLASYPQQITLLAQASSVFTTLKWAFYFISVVLVLVGAASLLLPARFKTPRRKRK